MNADETVQQLRYMAENSRSKHDVLVDTISLIKSLQAQLAESQHREQAAVKQIEQKMIFDAGMGREPCEICANAEKTPCIHCEPKWRGPQEAGGGERMIKSVEMNRIAGTAKSFGVSVVDDGYIRIYGGMVSLGRRCANKRRDEMSVSVADIKAAIAEHEAAQAGEGD